MHTDPMIGRTYITEQDHKAGGDSGFAFAHTTKAAKPKKKYMRRANMAVTRIY